MITIIHGDDTAASRNYFIDLKQAHPGASSFEGQELSLTDLAQILSGGELFSETKIIFIEQLLSKRKSSIETKAMLAYLQQHADTAQIFLWENKELERSTLTPFKGSTIKLFKLPQQLFAFLDSVKPGNGKNSLKLFHQALQTMDVEPLYFLLVKRVRLLLALNTQSALIEEVKRLGDYQKTMLQRQTKMFSQNQLVELHHKLFKIEEGQKTGTLPISMIASIDILLLEV